MSYPIVVPVDKFIAAFKGAWEAHQKLSPEEQKNRRWYQDVYHPDWSKPLVEGQNGVRFTNNIVTIGKQKGRPTISFINETNRASINPKHEKDVIELKQKYPNSKIEFKIRNMKPAFVVRKYIKVETEEDGFTIKKDDKGNPILPDSKTISKTFEAGYWFYKAFEEEIKYQKSIKKIVTEETKDGAPDKCIVVTNGIISSAIGTKIKKGKMAGKERSNPCFYLGIDINAKDPTKGTQILDKTKPFTKDGKKDFEKAKLDGVLVNEDNIHKWFSVRLHI